MKYITLGLVAHVDAGKTTLSEELLYESGVRKVLGRVDNGDTMLDNNEMERNRGITIFSKQAVIADASDSITILDTPGHVDFAAEMERTLQVLDYAVLVISASDGIQAHTRTLWRLLRDYNIPVFVFVNKMDQPDNDQSKLLEELTELSEDMIAFTDYQAGMVITDPDMYENIAVASGDETILDYYFEHQSIPQDTICELIHKRKIFPCYFGSALKGQGVGELLNGLKRYTLDLYTDRQELPFGARVYKITRDDKQVE